MHSQEILCPRPIGSAHSPFVSVLDRLRPGKKVKSAADREVLVGWLAVRCDSAQRLPIVVTACVKSLSLSNVQSSKWLSS